MKRLTYSGTKESKPDVTIREIVEKLTEYEDLEEQGALSKLTCNCTGCIHDESDECLHCMRAFSDCYELTN